MWLVGLLYAILASTFIFAKKTLTYSRPFFLIGFRMILAGTILLSYQWFAHRERFVLKKEDLWTFFKVALFHIYFAFTLEFWALQYLSALKTTIMYSATPFITALLSYFLLHEHLNFRKVMGICIGLGGLIPVLYAQGGNAEMMTEIFSVSLPEGVLALAIISSAYAWFIVMELMKKGYNLAFINGSAMLVGGVLSMITSLVIEGVSNPISDFWPFIGWLTLLILSANIILYNFYGWLLRRYSITFVAFAGFLCPGFAALYEWIFMQGTITWHYGVSLALVTCGLSIFYKDELKRITV